MATRNKKYQKWREEALAAKFEHRGVTYVATDFKVGLVVAGKNIAESLSGYSIRLTWVSISPFQSFAAKIKGPESKAWAKIGIVGEQLDLRPLPPAGRIAALRFLNDIEDALCYHVGILYHW